MSRALTKQTKEKSAAQYEIHCAMLDSLRNAKDGKWNADMLFLEIVKRGIDPRYASTGYVGSLTRAFAKAGYIQQLNNEFHKSTRHGGNLLNVWKVLPKTIPKV